MEEAQQESESGRALPSELVIKVSKPAPLAQARITVYVPHKETHKDYGGMKRVVIHFYGMAGPGAEGQGQ